MKQHGVTSDTFMFTTFTAFKELLQSNGRYYPSLKRFLPCNTKATNDYSDCTGVAYLCNRFFDVTCCNFLTQQAKVREMPDLKFDNDNYALTELLQFIWRSNMRVKESGKPVFVWVPDQRMRQLLQDFQKRALEHKRWNNSELLLTCASLDFSPNAKSALSNSLNARTGSYFETDNIPRSP